MEDKLKKNLDQVFNEKLGNQQANFEDSDWQKMLTLLEQEDVVPVVPVIDSNQPTKTNKNKNKNTWINLKNIIIMTTLALITAIITFWGNSVNENKKNTIELTKNSAVRSAKIESSGLISSDEKLKKTIELPLPLLEEKSNASTIVQGTKTTVVSTPSSTQEDKISNTNTQQKNAKNNAAMAVSETTPFANESTDANQEKSQPNAAIFDKINAMPSTPLPPKDSLKKALKFYKTISHQVWVEDRYEYNYIKPKYDIEDFWFGIHYTQQRPENQPLFDSMGLRDVAHGFNMQFMSGNLLKGEYWAVYGGLDWGMQFYGRSKDVEVLINSANQDKGLTHLRSSSTDFLARFHFEYAQFPIIPYVNIAGGPRILMTGQQVSSLLTSNEYESSNSHNVSNDVALMANVGVGLRVKISPSVSLDARYEQYYGGKAQVVDLQNSQFVGTEYTLSKNKINTNSSQFKFGFIFDLSQHEEEKTLVEPGHYETKSERYYLDPSDTNKIIQPCPCGPCDERDDNRTRNIYDQGGVEEYPVGTRTRTNTGINIGSGTSGGSKKSFPGLKSKPVNH